MTHVIILCICKPFNQYLVKGMLLVKNPLSSLFLRNSHLLNEIRPAQCSENKLIGKDYIRLQKPAQRACILNTIKDQLIHLTMRTSNKQALTIYTIKLNRGSVQLIKFMLYKILKKIYCINKTILFIKNCYVS